MAVRLIYQDVDPVWSTCLHSESLILHWSGIRSRSSSTGLGVAHPPLVMRLDQWREQMECRQLNKTWSHQDATRTIKLVDKHIAGWLTIGLYRTRLNDWSWFNNILHHFWLCLCFYNWLCFLLSIRPRFTDSRRWLCPRFPRHATTKRKT